MDSAWLMLILSMPGRSGTPRMRIWRSVKASGAGILRDGVYLLPDSPEHRSVFEKLCSAVRELDGTAYLLQHSAALEGSDEDFESLFDRTDEYKAWQERAVELEGNMRVVDEAKARRQENQLRTELEAIARIDFFPGESNRLALQFLEQMSARLNQHYSPGEPTAQPGVVHSLSKDQFQNRTWVTRADLWVDRVSSAWLIQRHIDAGAEFIWLDAVEDRPKQSLGFDFDGADFTHVDRLVSFEVLMKSFTLDTDAALCKIAELVHYLDVGGLSVAEAPGFLAMLVGAKHHSANDDEFAKRIFETLDDLYVAFKSEKRTSP